MSDSPLPAADIPMTEHSQSLEDAALEWQVLLHSGNATAAQRMAYQQWRQTSPAHAAAAQEAQQLWGDLGQTRAAEQHRAATATGSWRGWPALVASLVLAVASGVGWWQWPALTSDYHTAVGQQQHITLADGSRVTLNSGSALSVAYSAGERRVILQSGEALFEPVADPQRPFVVQADAQYLHSAASAFSLRRDGSRLTVVVREGQVQFTGDHAPVLLQADQRLQYQSGQPLLAQQAVDAASLTAWQRGKLIFNGRPLGEVIGELERYQHGRILISDSQLAALAISGVFDLHDPQGSLQALQQRYPLQVTYLPWLAVLH
ncbi:MULTISPECIES: FecR family protein [Pseudomonas]|uniref:FecR family protein n=2 Tax=Pseudomonas TaxID=286 RepID=A0A9Q6IBD4_9PSED|nr:MULTISPECIES: FecR family protein [Pseudomonas]MBS7562637.1 FecR family protein [Pseudomonas sp. RC4D1]MBW8357404.1 FecR family protein [Pseudomonas sp.]MCO7579656.1 FecR family protein [Pseudomonas protegens]MCO7585518.1 FecR family protein [Pseudomonas chlororaphis]MCO7602694.1 FecR family protein [Pseudomonas chlororaphis]